VPTARYFVIQDRDAWMIRYADEEFGPYHSRDEAMVFAIDAAQKLVRYGESVQVCLMGENGHFRPEWSSGGDAHRPRL
jgi:hypothetical protein